MKKRLLLSLWMCFLPLLAEGGESLRKRIKIRKKIQLERSQPNESEEYNIEKGKVLSLKRRKLIDDIKRFIRDARDSRQKGELNLRLGALLLEDYYSLLAESQVMYDKQMTEWEKSGKKGRAPRYDNSEALKTLESARVIYKDLVKKYRKHPRRDEMLYFLALTSMDRNRTTEGMRYFKKLSVETPRSKYVNDALVQLGDHYFEKNQYRKAMGYFNRLLAKRYKPLMSYATYKKAWCLYNQQNFKGALKLFEWVILNSEDLQQESAVQVRREALKDITLPFVDLKLVNQGIAFFKRFDSKIYRDGLTTMAALFYEQGNYPQAIKMYQVLLQLDSNHKDNPGFEVNIVEALMLQNRQDAAVDRLFKRLPIYVSRSTWYELNASRPKVIKEAFEEFEKLARKHAFRLHAEGQKTKNSNLYDVAKEIYAQYIRFFPRTEHAPQVRFYLAEILFKQKIYVEAAKHYWLSYKDPRAGKLRLDSIRYALTSLDRQLNIDRKKKGLGAINSKSGSKLKATLETKLELIPFSQVESQFLAIAAEYLRSFPKQKDAPDVLYEQSYLRYVHHELLPAYKGFWILVQKYPEHETTLSAAYLILDILNRRKDYPKLVAACKRFLENRKWQRKSFRNEVADILRRAELKRIQQAESTGKYKEAADGYVEYTKAYGAQDAKLYETALYNASVNYMKADELLKAVETQERFLRRFPQSKLNQEILLQVANTYESLANFDKAARYYDDFATRYPRNRQSEVALRLSGLYYWGSGKSLKAEKTMKTFLARYPRSRELVVRDLIDMYETDGQHRKLIAFYLSQRQAQGTTPAQYLDYSVRIGELQAKGRGSIPPSTMKSAMAYAQRNRRSIKRDPKGVDAYAKLAFYYARQADERFSGIKLSLPQSRLEANLQKKMGMLNQLEQEYKRVTGLGSGEWGLASIYRTALAYRHMAETVLTAPVPSELTGEQLEMYRNELSKQMIAPFNEKALTIAEACLDKAQELNLMSIWTPKCYTLAGKLREQRYPLARTLYLSPTRTAVLYPKQGRGSMAMGGVKRYPYPFFSSSLFERAQSRSLAGMELPTLYSGGLDNSREVVPGAANYAALGDERTRILRASLKSNRPGRSNMNFAYLHTLAIVQPKKALPEIRRQVERDPKNEALHNLMGLAYLESGNMAAAKVTWLSMVARGAKNATLWNNLGVAAYLEGNEAQARDYFQEAILNPEPTSAYVNLGFIALKYRNGFEAKKHFERALGERPEDAQAQVGFAVALLQNREIDNAKENLVNLAKRYRSDPFARLSLGYFLMDVEKQNQLAQRILSDYMSTQSVQNDPTFRRALQEARSIASTTSGDLPEISMD